MFRILRLVITLLIALSLVRSVVMAFQRLMRGQHQPPPAPPQTRDTSASGAEHSTLHQDPVCGTYVSTETSLKRLYQGRVLHFCSAECRDRFNA